MGLTKIPYSMITGASVNVLDFGADPSGLTDSSSAVQTALDYICPIGGKLEFPEGTYLFESQVTIDRSQLTVDNSNLLVSGYGAEIITSGSISAFNVTGGKVPNQCCTIEGFAINHSTNTTATSGISMSNAVLVTCRNISVAVNGSLPAGYAAFSLQNGTDSDPNTGCFWVTIEGCSVRPYSSGDGFCDYGVMAMGAANALTLRNNMFSGSNTHVILKAHAGQTYTPNAANIDGNFFEGPSTATGIDLVGAAASGSYHITGTRITNNRFESLTNAVTLTGAGADVQVPTYMSGNYAANSITHYLVNTLSVPVILLDSALVVAPVGTAVFTNSGGTLLKNIDTSSDTLTVRAPNATKGFALQRSDGSELGHWRYAVINGIAGSLLGGEGTKIMGLTNIRGISMGTTASNNMAGAGTFSASTTKAITFANAEADDNYFVFLEARADQKLWVTSKTANGFTVNSDVSSSNSFGWFLLRYY